MIRVCTTSPSISFQLSPLYCLLPSAGRWVVNSILCARCPTELKETEGWKGCWKGQGFPCVLWNWSWPTIQILSLRVCSVVTALPLRLFLPKYWMLLVCGPPLMYKVCNFTTLSFAPQGIGWGRGTANIFICNVSVLIWWRVKEFLCQGILAMKKTAIE